MKTKPNSGTEQFKGFIRHLYAWPGGYPRFALMEDGEAICRKCAASNFRQLMRSTKDNARDGWTCIGAEINWESEDLTCAHCNAPIESAYGDPQ